MLGFLERTRLFLWLLVEIAFLAVVAVVLIHLIIGPDSGVFVSTVADNVMKFAGGIPPQSMVGLALVLALVFLIANRFKPRDRA